MSTVTPSASSASAWSGKSMVDTGFPDKHGLIVLDNQFLADHSIAGLDANQEAGDIVTLINRGIGNFILAPGDTAAAVKDRFVSQLYLAAGGRVQLYYNGLAWEPFSDVPSSVIAKVIEFKEDDHSISHTGTVTLPPGAYLHAIEVLNAHLWGAAAAVMTVGDTADDDGFFTGIDLKATDLLVGEILNSDPSTTWGGKEGAYLVAATGRRGPVTNNFGKYYAAGSDITGIITVTTPGVNTGRSYMLVKYSVPNKIAAVTADPPPDPGP